MHIDWLGKPYYSLNAYFQHTYGQKIYKIAVDAGLTCPNRDGTLDTRGCSFCSAGGSGDFSIPIFDVYHKEYAGRESNQRKVLDVSRQIERGMAKFNKSVGERFVIYFQAYTNTYGDISYLRSIWEMALKHEKVVGISIATRPDCLSKEILKELEVLQKIYSKQNKFVWIELGLQTKHEKTAIQIRRHYDISVYETAIKELEKINIPFIVHVILGLPGETKEDMLETVRYACNTEQKPQGIKLQLLHVLKNTDLAKQYEAGEFATLSMEEYLDLVAKCLRVIPKNVVVHRLTGDGPKKILISPTWSGNKKMVLNSLHKYLKEKNVVQGE